MTRQRGLAADPPVPPGRTGPPSPSARIGGALLLLPALVLWLTGLVAPSLSTLQLSFQDLRGFRAGDSGPAGLQNYTSLAITVPFGHVAMMLLRSLLAGLPGIVLGVLTGSLASGGTRVVRGLVAAVLGALAVCWAPVGVALSLWYGGHPDGRGGAQMLNTQPEMAVLSSLVVVVLPVTAAASGAVCLLLGRGQPGRRIGPGSVGAAVGLLAGLAAAAQSFTVPLVTTQGGPANRTMTTTLAIYQVAFVNGRLGVAAALSVVLGLLLGALGLLAGVLLIATRTGLQLRPTTAASRIPALGWLGLTAAVLSLAAVLGSQRHWFASFAQPASTQLPPLLPLWTWGPPAMVVAGQLLVAVLAGTGIGALRPLGGASKWLLLPFLPWLFVGDGPLVVANLRSAATGGNLNDPWYSPVWVSVPLIVVATLVAEALTAHRAAGDDSRIPTSDAVLGAVGAAVAITTLAWIARANALLWPLTSTSRVDQATGPVALQMLSGRGTGDLPFTAGTPLYLFVLQIALVAAGSWLALDRFALAPVAQPRSVPVNPTPPRSGPRPLPLPPAPRWR